MISQIKLKIMKYLLDKRAFKNQLFNVHHENKKYAISRNLHFWCKNNHTLEQKQKVDNEFIDIIIYNWPEGWSNL